MVTGVLANRRLKRMEDRIRNVEETNEATQQFLFQKFGAKIEIKAEGSFEAPKADVDSKGQKEKQKSL